MRRLLSSWILSFVILFAVCVVTLRVSCPGCIDRTRVNAMCEWRGDTAFSIDPQNTAHYTHLVGDAQLAEDLAIRYADASFKRGPRRDRRFSLEHLALGKSRVRSECLSRMFQVIEDNHSVTPEQVGVARGQRNQTFDLAATLLFLPFYSLGMVVACRRLYRRFSSHEPHIRLVATALASAPASFLGLQCLRLWLAMWEVVRVGNGHMGTIRAATETRWHHQYVGEEFIGGILLFCLVALFFYRIVSEDEHTADVRLPYGIMLR